MPDQDQLEGKQGVRVLVEAMFRTRQPASAWPEEVMIKAMHPEASSLCVFHRDDVDGSGLVHGDDIIIVTRRWHLGGSPEALAQHVGHGSADNRARR